MLITGASSGIGLALLRLARQAGYRVVATARTSSMPRFSRASISESEGLILRPLDVTSAPERESLIDEVSRTWGGVDILVNNAGIAYRSVIEHMSKEDEQLQFATNYFGPMELTRLILPHMRRMRSGKIINVSSVGGMMAMPTMGSYSASKFALEGASEALWYELRPWNVNVVLVQPGFVHSNAFRHVYWTRRGKTSLTQPDAYQPYYAEMQCFIERLMTWARATPESVARTILTAIENPTPPLRVAATIDAVFFSWIRRFLPRRVYHRILYASLPGIKKWGKMA